MESFRDMPFRPACHWVTWLPMLINVTAGCLIVGKSFVRPCTRYSEVEVEAVARFERRARGVTADTRNCPEMAIKLAAGGHEKCPLAAMRSARHV